MEDKMFHIFLREIQESRGADNVLGAEKIIGLYKVKSGAACAVCTAIKTSVFLLTMDS